MSRADAVAAAASVFLDALMPVLRDEFAVTISRWSSLGGRVGSPSPN
jgi:hypothetical protein